MKSPKNTKNHNFTLFLGLGFLLFFIFCFSSIYFIYKVATSDVFRSSSTQDIEETVIHEIKKEEIPIKTKDTIYITKLVTEKCEKP
jgi:hypothetical protein